MKILRSVAMLVGLILLVSTIEAKENNELIRGAGNTNGTININEWTALGKVFSVTKRNYNGNKYLYTTNKEDNGGAYQAFSTEIGKKYKVQAILLGTDVNTNEVFYTKSASYMTIDDSIPNLNNKSDYTSKMIVGSKEVSIEFYFTATASTSYLSYRSTKAWQYANVRDISVTEISNKNIIIQNSNENIDKNEHINKSVVPLIIDTDMLTDCDDAAALGIAHALEDNGEVKILAVTLSGHEHSNYNSITVSAINYYYNNNNDIPIGSWHELVKNGGLTYSMQEKFRFSGSPHIHKKIKEKHSHDNILNHERESSLDIYRRVLSEARDHSVKIVVIGASFNIARLLKEEKKLVEKKVKEIIFSAPYGSCNQNMCVNGGLSRPEGKRTTDYVFENLPTNVQLTISGGENESIYVNKKYYDAGTKYKGTESPMETAYENAYNAINEGRPIYDHMAVLAAVREEKLDEYWDVYRDGYFVSKFSKNGRAYWINSKRKNHVRLEFNKSKVEKMVNEIHSLMVQKPK